MAEHDLTQPEWGFERMTNSQDQEFFHVTLLPDGTWNPALAKELRRQEDVDRLIGHLADILYQHRLI